MSIPLYTGEIFTNSLLYTNSIYGGRKEKTAQDRDTWNDSQWLRVK